MDETNTAVQNPQDTATAQADQASAADQDTTPSVDALQAELDKLRKDSEAKAKQIAQAEFTLKQKTKEFADFKRSHLSEAEQLKEERQAAEEMNRQLKLDRNTVRAEKILLSGQLAEDDYKDFLEYVVFEDPDRTEDLTQRIVDLVQRKMKTAAELEREKVLKEQPAPPAGNGGGDQIDPFIEAFKKG